MQRHLKVVKGGSYFVIDTFEPNDIPIGRYPGYSFLQQCIVFQNKIVFEDETDGGVGDIVMLHNVQIAFKDTLDTLASFRIPQAGYTNAGRLSSCNGGYSVPMGNVLFIQGSFHVGASHHILVQINIKNILNAPIQFGLTIPFVPRGILIWAWLPLISTPWRTIQPVKRGGESGKQ